MPGNKLRFSRPAGTGFNFVTCPGVETPGYFRVSRWDEKKPWHAGDTPVGAGIG